MARFASSEVGLEVLVALQQHPDGLGLSELARCLGRGTSAVQRALDVLTEDGLVLHGGGRAPFVPHDAEPACAAAQVVALRLLPDRVATRITLRASPVPLFAGESAEGFAHVPRPLAGDDEELRLAAALRIIVADRPGTCPVERIPEPEARTSAGIARRLSRMEPLKGTAEMFLPKARAERGRALRRLHPSLGRIPRAALLKAARRHHLQRVVAFGSAVRSDFTAGSDVDLLVEPQSGRALALADRVEIASTFEGIFGRSVDLVPAVRARPAVLEEARREGVVLIG